MYVSKRGQIGLVVVLIVLLSLVGVFAWFVGGGFTGAVVSEVEVPVENLALSDEDIDVIIESTSDMILPTANCGGATTCNCGDRITSNYTMTSALEDCSTESALVIGANDVVLDCHNYHINSSGGNTYGINNSAGYDNVQILNCNVSGVLRGITVGNSKSNNFTIWNTTIDMTHDSGTYGIYYYNSSNSSIDNSRIFVPTSANGIHLDSSPFGNVTNNIINLTPGSSTAFTGQTNSDNGYFSNNTVESQGPGVIVDSRNFTIDNNKIIVSGGYGIDVFSAGSAKVIDNSITSHANSWYAIYAGGSNFSIQGNVINVTQDSSAGIYVGSEKGAMVFKNIVNASGNSDSYGVELSGTTQSSFVDNILTTSQSSTIYLSSGTNNIFRNNSLNQTGAGDYGFNIGDGNNFFYGNTVHSAGYGFYVSNANNNWFQDNTILFNVTTGFHLFSSTAGSTLLNNNITSTGLAVFDETTTTERNYLIYNNSFGEIKWIDNGTGGFISNLTITSDIYFGKNIFINNHSAAVNLSSFGPTSLIGFNANITLYQMNFSIVNTLHRVENASNTSSVFILSNGEDCQTTNCTIISQGFGRVIFNTTHLGSFAVNGTSSNFNTIPNVTSVFVNASTTNNGTFNDLYCYINTNDGEQNLLGVEWIWYNGSNAVLAGNTTVNKGNVSLVSTLDDSYTTSGEGWNCSVQVNDGFTTSSWNSSNISVDSAFCGDSVTNNVTLTRSLLDCSATGLNVTHHGITLDCNGYSINGTNYGTGVRVNASGVTVKNCQINNFDRGIDLTNGVAARGSVFILNNVISLIDGNGSNDGAIIVQASTGSGFKIRNNNISHSNKSAIKLFSTISGVDSYGNILNNNSYGFWLEEFSINNNFSTEIITNSSFAIYANESGASLTTDIHRNTFRDSYFSENTNDVFISKETSANITIINSSTDKTKITAPTTSNVFFKLYVDVYINDTSGNPITNANVTAHNSIERLEDSNLTNSDGFTRMEVTEYYRSGKQNFFVTPSTIGVSFNNFTSNSTNVNLINATYTKTYLKMSQMLCGSTITSSFSLGSNYLCSGDGFTIDADDVTILGNGYNLTGLGTGKGISVTSRNNFNLIDLRITNFSRGVYYESSHHGNLTGVTLVNNTIGVLYNNSNNNSIFGGLLINNSLHNLLSTGNITNNSLINVSGNRTNVTTESNASIFFKYYVDVNVTNDGVSVPNANIFGYFNDTQDLDDSAVSEANGVGRLELTELKKNSTGDYVLTPHNISVYFDYLGNNISNFTHINLTQTNSTSINLSLSLNCTSPSGTHSVTTDTTFCPGTFSVEQITIDSSNLEISCVQTVLKADPSSSALSIIRMSSMDHVKISSCNIDSTSSSSSYGLWAYDADNLTVTNTSFVGGEVGYLAVNCEGCTNFSFVSSNITGYYTGISFSTSVDGITRSAKINSSFFSNTINLQIAENTIVYNSTFEGGDGIQFESSTDSLIINNSFTSLDTAISCSATDDSVKNNQVYYNVFSSNTVNLENCKNGDHFNTTFNDSAQGNEWSDYCDKGVDNNNDGYADASNAGVVDWPYNETTSTRVTGLATESTAADYGPKIITCPAENVFLSSSGSSGGSSGDSAGGGTGAPAAAASTGSVSAPAAAATSCGSNEVLKATGCTCIEGYERVDGVCVKKKVVTDGLNVEIGKVIDSYGEDNVPPTLFQKVYGSPLSQFGCLNIEPLTIKKISEKTLSKALDFQTNGKTFDFAYDVAGEKLQLYLMFKGQVGDVCAEFDIFTRDPAINLEKKANPVLDFFTYQNMMGKPQFINQLLTIDVDRCSTLAEDFRNDLAWIYMKETDCI